MGYALFWVETMAAALLLIALVTAAAARFKLGLARWLPPVVTLVVLMAAAFSIAGCMGWLKYDINFDQPWFPYSLLWALTLTLAGVAVLYVGLWRSYAGSPRALLWPPWQLTFGCIAAAALAGITLSTMDAALKMQLGTERAEAGARLLSLRPASVPSRDNAAFLYQKAFDSLSAADTAWKENVPGWKDGEIESFDPRDPKVKAFLDSQQPALELLRQAAQKPDCVFEHDYGEGFDMPLPEIQALLNASRRLQYDAISKAAHGDGKAAIADVQAIFGIAEHMKAEPFLVSTAAAVWAQRNGAIALEKVLALAAPTRRDLSGLTLVRNVSFKQALKRGLLIDETAGVGCFLNVTPLQTGVAETWLNAQIGPFGSWFLSSIFYRVFFLSDDLNAYRQTLKQQRQRIQAPYPLAREESTGTDINFIFRNDAKNREIPGLLTKIVVPHFPRLIRVAGQGDALYELLRLAKATWNYRQDKGKYPEKLDELVPAYIDHIPRDPFDGQPLRMKKETKGLVLYSVGPQLRNAGIAPENKNGFEEKITFQLP